MKLGTNLAIGDTILVPTGARIPVDGVLISTSALIERAFLSGEAAAVEIVEDALLQAGEI